MQPVNAVMAQLECHKQPNYSALAFSPVMARRLFICQNAKKTAL